MTSEGGIFLVFQWGCGKICEIRQNRPRNVQKSDILAFEGRFGGLKDSLEVRVEHGTCRTIHGTHLEGISSQKNRTGLAGGGQERSFLAEIWLMRPPWAPESCFL